MHSSLKRQIDDILQSQGYILSKNGFFLADDALESLRKTHSMSRKERVSKQAEFIRDNAKLIHGHMIDGRNLNVENISPKLIPITKSSDLEVLFRWWNYVWWSVPYEKAYGRQMRYIVWDKHHEAVIGLIGLQSPILSWAPRDQYLSISASERDYWVNQSMSAQRLGALPPYNTVLGGKLIAMLMTSDKLRKDFRKKYSEKTTILRKRELPANLLFVTTTGAFGKSSIYTRLKFREDWLAKFIGYSNGSGSFHISNEIYEKLLLMLDKKGINVRRGYGNGPSRKMRLIRQGMTELGYKNGGFHGVKRAVYLFSFAKNLEKLIIGKNQRPLWHHRREDDLTDFWKTRWILPRIEKRRESLLTFNKEEYISRQMEEIGCL